MKENKANSLDKALQIIDCFSYQRPELSAAEIGHILDFPPATLYRQLSALEETKLIERDPKTKLYSIGLKTVELAGIALSRYEAKRLGQSNLDALCQNLNMNANMSVLYECDTFHLSYSVCQNTALSYTTLGRRTPATQTAMGRVLLSGLDEKDCRQLVQRFGLRPMTSYSFKTIESLLVELEKIREQGFAIDHKAVSEVCCCFAAPIRARSGEIVAAISVSTTPERFENEYEKIKSSVLAQAFDLNSKLGFYQVDHIYT